ncbi:EAL domain-containing protein [Photobacterium rosenbergii]|uniref:EAL domain-containing protein n=1 Tax=Photobacterium rosenbergii TaxID=294936 RepID=A0ABU3ZES6_9GAMM|nr:EAL domain-containing protein [Photobacterium rosenbergii]MDV5168572.1 EAL domain-containing protein [Photobacterium rosenbergii]
MKVLIVEDDRIQASKLKLDLMSLGAEEVLIAANCLSAMKLCDQYNFNLIFCDIQLPDHDGIYLLSKIADKCYKSHVVIISAGNSRLLSHIERIGSLLAFKQVTRIDKPYDINALNSLIKNTTCKAKRKKDKCSYNQQLEFTEREILEAIENKHIFVHYQPQIDINTGSIVGLEALARWDHPDYGVVTANQFVNALCEGQTHVRLFQTILEKSLVALQALPESMQLSINITDRDIQWSGLYDSIYQTCALHNFAPNRLKLELSENHLYQADVFSLLTLSRLKLIGVKLSIDDLGLGYSSLIKLTQIPIDEIKINRNLIQNVETDFQKSTIVQLIFNLAQKMQLTCVAEGIEKSETLHYLKSLGISIFQGYLIGKPLPINDITAMISRQFVTDAPAPIHCLIVDDHPIIGAALCQSFKLHNQVQSVASAKNILQALNYIRDNQCNLLLIDINLRGESGFELISQAREKGFQGKVIFMSSGDKPNYPFLSLEKGGIGFIDKGVDVNCLVQQVIQLATSHTQSVDPTVAPSQKKRSSMQSLSKREHEVLDSLMSGHSNKSIANTLSLSEKTVSTYKSRIFDKLGVNSLIEISKMYF